MSAGFMGEETICGLYERTIKQQRRTHAAAGFDDLLFVYGAGEEERKCAAERGKVF